MNLPTNFEARAYQEKAIKWLASKRQGIIQVPAGGGKTVIAAAALNKVITAKPRNRQIKVGWIAPTIETRDQGRAAVKMFPVLSQHDFRFSCAAPGVDMADRDVLIVDECKHSASAMWFQIIRQCSVRWGLDATPFSGDKERDDALLEMFGNNILTIPREELSDKLAKAKVILLSDTDYNVGPLIDQKIRSMYNRLLRFSSQDPGQLWAQVAWQMCGRYGIMLNGPRNNAIIQTANKHAIDKVLVLVNHVEHGELLLPKITGAKLCHSKMGKRERRETLEDFKSGSLNCVIATSMLDEGADIPCANVLILGSGGRSSGRTEQRTGRVLRKFAGKEFGLIYDFKDLQHKLMAKHAAKRQEVYINLGYQIQT